MTPELAIALVVVGLPSTAGVIYSIVKFSFARNVQHADDAVKAAEAKQDEHEKKLQEIRDAYRADLSALRTELVSATHKTELSSEGARTQLAALAGSLGELKGALGGLREMFDEGREKQAQFYREALKKVEQDFRQELSRTSHPDLPDRVSKLEARLTVAKRK